MPKIALLDYGVGNLYSVANALKVAGADVVITSDPKDIKSADKILLPGVGAMEECHAPHDSVQDRRGGQAGT